MSQKLIEIAKVFQTPLKLNARAGDKVLDITDTGMDPLLWRHGLATCWPTAWSAGAGGHRDDAARAPCSQPGQPRGLVAHDPGGRLVVYLYQHGDGACASPTTWSKPARSSS